MSIQEHGLSFGINRVNDNLYMNMKVIGKLSHDDYEIMIPMLEKAIRDIRQPVIRAIVDLTELEGWELRAAWDDLKLGLRHNREFEKVALLGNRNWEKVAARVSNWFTSGEIRYFEDRQEALAWLEQPPDS